MRYKRKHTREEEPNNIILDIKKKAGCYRIYLSECKEISRLAGIDESGLLYIGSTAQSNGLLKRIRDFFDSATNSNANEEPSTAHEAGRFYQLYVKCHLGEAIDVLEFEFDIKISGTDAKNTEALQLKDYLLTYGELPPLNRQLPKNI